MASDWLFFVLAAVGHLEDTANMAGLSERTVYGRWADPGFRSRLNAARKSLRNSILARLADAGHDAIGTLFDLLQNEDDNVRPKAAKTLIGSLTAGHSTMPGWPATIFRTVEIRESRQAFLAP